MLYLPWTIYSRDFYLNWTLSWGPHPAVNHVFFVPGGNQDLTNEIILLRCPMYGQWVQSFQTDKSNGIGSWCSPKTKPSCHRNLGSFTERAKLHAWTCSHRNSCLGQFPAVSDTLISITWFIGEISWYQSWFLVVKYPKVGKLNHVKRSYCCSILRSGETRPQRLKHGTSLARSWVPHVIFKELPCTDIAIDVVGVAFWAMGSVSLKGVRFKVVALRDFSGHFKKENMDEHCYQLIMSAVNFGIFQYR